MPAYDPKKVSFTWGSITPKQYGTDSMIKVTFNEDQFTYTASATGSGARSLSANRSGRVEVTLLAADPANDQFMAQAAIDLATGAGSQPGLVKDLYTPAAYAFAQHLWCVKVPDMERAKAVGEVTWTFETDALDLKQGGATAGAI